MKPLWDFILLDETGHHLSDVLWNVCEKNSIRPELVEDARVRLLLRE